MEDLKDMYVMGIDKAAYSALLEQAKKEGKSVNELIQDALKEKLEQSKQVQENKKLLLG